MFDYFKIVSDCIPDVGSWQYVGTDRKTRPNENLTEETTVYERYQYNSLQVTIIDGKTTQIEGSFHKFFNQGIHNSNTFTINDYRAILEQFKGMNLLPDKCILKKLEIGINVDVTAIDERLNADMIPRACKMYKRSEFKNYYTRTEGTYQVVKMDRAYLKNYNKSKHPATIAHNQTISPNAPCPNNVWRWEVHHNKMAWLNSIGVWSLADLTKPSIIATIGDDLVSKWNHIVFVSPFCKELQQFRQYDNQNFWIDLKEGCRSGKYYRNRFTFEVEKLVQMHHVQGDHLHEDIARAITNKWNEISANAPCPETSKNTHFSANAPMYSGHLTYCLVTNLDISMQREDSKFLTAVGIRWYYENDNDQYLQLHAKYLKRSKYKNSDLDIQFREIAHQVRNKYFNKENNSRSSAKKMIEKRLQQPSLFDQLPFIKSEIKRRAGYEN